MICRAQGGALRCARVPLPCQGCTQQPALYLLDPGQRQLMVLKFSWVGRHVFNFRHLLRPELPQLLGLPAGLALLRVVLRKLRRELLPSCECLELLLKLRGL